jgi:hypothetical protein
VRYEQLSYLPELLSDRIDLLSEKLVLQVILQSSAPQTPLSKTKLLMRHACTHGKELAREFFSRTRPVEPLTDHPARLE